MASSSLQKLIRNQTRPASAFFTHFTKPPSPPPPFALPQIAKPNDPSPDQPAADHFNLKNPILGQVYYPTFSFEFLLHHPVPSPTPIPPESDDAIVIRADSVKKKRKKKMNKHKLKKLSKRLRRKTKA
ncbi:hypothetical protein AAHA92_31721 [Salvia divinorum]|uniref:Small ribosomal subunit protein mS38 n=1 Tax=Salvia divinorum TaxID=28513 RepID=A0ABD1FIC9_SALDI